MFMDFKFFDEVVQATEEHRRQTQQAWEDWVDFMETSAKYFGVEIIKDKK